VVESVPYRVPQNILKKKEGLTVTVVPLFRPVRSRVSPAGTVMSLRTMLVQADLPDLAAAAVVKVQELRTSSLASLASSGVGEPATRELAPRRAKVEATRIFGLKAGRNN
jgi:hypothetical protein